MKAQKKIRNHFLKKIFIRLCRLFGFEIIDQSTLEIPTKNKQINEILSEPNIKSITIPMGEIKITRKIVSLDIFFKFCTTTNIVSQNKDRLFSNEKYEYTLRSLLSILRSIENSKKYFKNLKIKIFLLNGGCEKNILSKIENIFNKFNTDFQIINVLENSDIQIIDNNVSENIKSVLLNIYKSFEITKKNSIDLVYYVEDDYLHDEDAFTEMLFSYEKFSSIIKSEIILCPVDYPYLYNKFENTKIVLGNKKHWRIVEESLLTFLTSKEIIIKYWNLLSFMTKKYSQPFEKPLHEIYKKEYCFSPIPSLATHLTNINSIFGLSPMVDWVKIWEKNNPDNILNEAN